MEKKYSFLPLKFKFTLLVVILVLTINPTFVNGVDLLGKDTKSIFKHSGLLHKKINGGLKQIKGNENVGANQGDKYANMVKDLTEEQKKLFTVELHTDL